MVKLGLVNFFCLLLFLNVAWGDERSVVEDARDGVLDDHGLLESALELSSPSFNFLDDATLSRFAELQDVARRQCPSDANELQKAEIFLRALHSNRLSFDANCDRVDEAFQSGRYNCVTSLIFALEFCRREKISASGMQSGSHVWLRIGDTSDGDLETTQLLVGDAARIGATKISDAQLLSRLVYNQARTRHEQGYFAEAAKRLDWCLLIDPKFLAAERNLRIVLENWMAAAERDLRFSVAIAVSERAIARFPADAEFRKNAAYLQVRWAQWLALHAD